MPARRCYRTGVNALLPWLVVLQVAVLPALAPGAEVRLVSADLLDVHALGRVEDGRLRLEGRPPAPGARLRLLVFPPDADADAAARAASGARSLEVRVVDGELRVRGADGDVSLRELLARQGIELIAPGEDRR
jgi:hypothetical protein